LGIQIWMEIVPFQERTFLKEIYQLNFHNYN
jgi:hypothetical protein